MTRAENGWTRQAWVCAKKDASNKQPQYYSACSLGTGGVRRPPKTLRTTTFSSVWRLPARCARCNIRCVEPPGVVEFPQLTVEYCGRDVRNQIGCLWSSRSGKALAFHRGGALDHAGHPCPPSFSPRSWPTPSGVNSQEREPSPCPAARPSRLRRAPRPGLGSVPWVEAERHEPSRGRGSHLPQRVGTDMSRRPRRGRGFPGPRFTPHAEHSVDSRCL